MYRKFIEEHFGNVHLSGFEYLVRSCELYAEGSKDICTNYRIIAEEHKGTRYGRIERAIRYYVHNIYPHILCSCLPTMNKPTNGSVIAAIVYEVNKEARHV